MNIFVLDLDPREAALAQCDKHIVKMPLEAAQVLCTVVRAHDPERAAPYKATHRRHPCTLWAGASLANFDWLVAHGLALCEEYSRRYGRQHACQAVIVWAHENRDCVPAGALTEFAQAMPVEYQSHDVVAAYRAYYAGAKEGIATWSRSSAPSWWKNKKIEN